MPMLKCVKTHPPQAKTACTLMSYIVHVVKPKVRSFLFVTVIRLGLPKSILAQKEDEICLNLSNGAEQCAESKLVDDYFNLINLTGHLNLAST